MTPERRGFTRPTALAGWLWLLIAAPLGLATIYLALVAPLIALLYALPLGALAALGYRLITRQGGVGLALVSLILGAGLSAMSLIEALRQDPAGVGTIVGVVYGGAIASTSAFAVWAARSDLPALREGLGQRAARILLVGAAILGVLAFATNVGPLRGCVPIAPRELPSGAASGTGVEGVAGGAKQVVWGSGADRVEQIVGLTYWDTLGVEESPTLVGSVTIHGQPATIYRMSPLEGDWDLGFSWAEDGCDRSVFLPRGTTPEQAQAYAERY